MRPSLTIASEISAVRVSSSQTVNRSGVAPSADPSCASNASNTGDTVTTKVELTWLTPSETVKVRSLCRRSRPEARKKSCLKPPTRFRARRRDRDQGHRVTVRINRVVGDHVDQVDARVLVNGDRSRTKRALGDRGHGHRHRRGVASDPVGHGVGDGLGPEEVVGGRVGKPARVGIDPDRP